MSDSILRDKSKAFAKEVVFLCRRLKQNNIEGALINQLLRSGTSVGANVHEAQYAQGIKDFISKFEIALKECNESEYWLELLFEVNSLSQQDFNRLQKTVLNYEGCWFPRLPHSKANKGISDIYAIWENASATLLQRVV